MRKNHNPLFKRPDSPYFFCRVWDPATRHMVKRCTETEDEKKAFSFYERLKREIETKGVAAIREQKVTLADLARGLTDHYQINGLRTSKRMGQAMQNLKAFFGEFATIPKIDALWPKYIEHRKAPKDVEGRHWEGAANATINYERAMLHKALRLAQEKKRLSTVPVLSGLKGGLVREGFVTEEMMDRIESELPQDLRAPIRFAFLTGWRISEVLSLRWPQVDFDKGTIRLEASDTKTKRARELAFDVIPALRDLLQRQWDSLEPTPFGPVTWGPREFGLVFPRCQGTTKGYAIKSYRGAWRSAVKRAGWPHLLVHDLRRSAARNLVAAGVHPTVARTVTGHVTLSMFERYAITTVDLQRTVLAASRYGTRATAPSDEKEPGRVISLKKPR